MRFLGIGVAICRIFATFANGNGTEKGKTGVHFMSQLRYWSVLGGIVGGGVMGVVYYYLSYSLFQTSILQTLVIPVALGVLGGLFVGHAVAQRTSDKNRQREGSALIPDEMRVIEEEGESESSGIVS